MPSDVQYPDSVQFDPNVPLDTSQIREGPDATMAPRPRNRFPVAAAETPYVDDTSDSPEWSGDQEPMGPYPGEDAMSLQDRINRAIVIQQYQDAVANGSIRPPKKMMGLSGEMPEADPDMTELPYEPEPVNGSANYHPNAAGAVDNEGIQSLPDTGDGVYRTDAPASNVVGNESDVNSWDYTYETIPVYAVPKELGGGEYVGQLEWAPSLPQDLKPIRFVKVPRMERMT